MKLQALYLKFSRNLKKEPVFGTKLKKKLIWSCFGSIIPVIIYFICSWNI